MADCYNGSLIREFDFAEPIGEKLIMHLGGDKKLDYFPDLPKPYFRIEAKGKYIIRGVRGNSTMRVVLKQPHPEMNLFALKAALEDFFSGEPDLRLGDPPPLTRRTSVGPNSGPRRTAVVPAGPTPVYPTPAIKKAVRKKFPDGFERKHFSARWRLKYLTRRDSGA
jgi:hypothetical protein